MAKTRKTEIHPTVAAVLRNRLLYLGLWDPKTAAGRARLLVESEQMRTVWERLMRKRRFHPFGLVATCIQLLDRYDHTTVLPKAAHTRRYKSLATDLRRLAEAIDGDPELADADRNLVDAMIDRPKTANEIAATLRVLGLKDESDGDHRDLYRLGLFCADMAAAFAAPAAAGLEGLAGVATRIAERGPLNKRPRDANARCRFFILELGTYVRETYGQQWLHEIDEICDVLFGEGHPAASSVIYQARQPSVLVAKSLLKNSRSSQRSPRKK